MQKIAFLIASTNVGGGDLYMMQLVRELDGRGVPVTLLLAEGHPFEPYLAGLRYVSVLTGLGKRRQSEPSKSDLRPLASDLRPLTSDLGSPTSDLRPSALWLRILVGELRCAWRLSRIMRQEQFDLIHSFEGGADMGSIAAALAGVPRRVASYCVLPTSRADAKPGDFGRRILEWISARCVNSAITKSESAKAEWIRRLPRSSQWMRVIYNGMQLESVCRPSDERLQALRHEFDCDGRPVIGMTARLHPMKGHSFLIEAMPAILKAVPDAVFLLVGDGELREDLQTQVDRLGVSESVRFLGHRDDVMDLTWLYDVAVLPSVAYETFGWAVVEAMACEKPVVVSDFDGLPEVVEHGVTGTVVPPRDSQALATAIIELLENADLRAQYGKAGRVRVAQKFTYDRMIAEHLHVWDGMEDKNPEEDPTEG